jgi:hypothetical protein
MPRAMNEPKKFRCALVRNGYAQSVGSEKGFDTENAAVNAATAYINQSRQEGVQIGVYQLVSVVKPKDIPVEVVKISVCKESKG